MTIFIVGYENLCGNRMKLLNQLNEVYLRLFFSLLFYISEFMFVYLKWETLEINKHNGGK